MSTSYFTSAVNPTTASGGGWVSTTNLYVADSAVAYANTKVGTPTGTLTVGSFTGITTGMGAGDRITNIYASAYYYADTATMDTQVTWLANSGAMLGSAQTLTPGAGTSPAWGVLNSMWGNAAYSLTKQNMDNLQILFYAEEGVSAYDKQFKIDTFSVSLRYEKATPSAFTFTDSTGATRSTVYTSNAIVVAGLEDYAGIWITGSGQYNINGGAYTTSPGTVVNGDSVRVKLTSSADWSTAVTGTVTIGNHETGTMAGVSDGYSVTTMAQDTTPTAFGWTTSTGVELGVVTQSSSTVTVAGINDVADLTISGASGEYSKNGAAWSTAATTVVLGDELQVKGTSSASYASNTTVTVTIGGVAGTFVITTRAADTVPNDFTFTDVTGATASTLYTSNEVTITGLEAAANVTFSTSGGSGYEYSKAGGAWTATGNTTITNGQTLKVRGTTGLDGTVTNITVTIGGVVESYVVTTASVDSTPDAFTFTAVTDALPGLLYTSNSPTISGLSAGVPIAASVNGGEMKINTGSWVASGTVQNGDTVTARRYASNIGGVVNTSIVTIGSSSSTYSVTTRPFSSPQDF